MQCLNSNLCPNSKARPSIQTLGHLNQTSLSYISIEWGECEWRDIPVAARYPFYLSQQRYEDRGSSRLDRGREHVM